MTEQELLKAAEKLQSLQIKRDLLLSFLSENQSSNSPYIIITDKCIVKHNSTTGILLSEENNSVLLAIAKTMVQRELERFEKLIKDVLP